MDILASCRCLYALQIRLAGVSDPEQRMALRVATRWLTAGMEKEYDIMLRLQVLEGAAGVPLDTWWKKGARGLGIAQKSFEQETLKPEWFDPALSGMFGVVQGILHTVINQYHLSITPYDMINNALMGIPLDASAPRETLRAAYESGRVLAAKIRGGQETPISVARGKLGTYLARKVLAEYKHIRLEQIGLPEKLDKEPGDIDIPDVPDEKDFGDAMTVIFFHSHGDTLSLKLRNLMRASWAESPPMLRWLQIVEDENRWPQGKEIADEFGIGAGFISNHWKPRWKKFLKELWRRKDLMGQLEDRMDRMGVVWNPKMPEGDQFLELLRRRDKPKTASSDVTRLTDRFLALQAS